MHMSIFTYIKPKIDSFVNGKTCHQPMLMVHMCSQRTHSVWRENMILVFFHDFLVLIKRHKVGIFKFRKLYIFDMFMCGWLTAS